MIMLTIGCRKDLYQQGEHLVIQIVLQQQCNFKSSKILQKHLNMW